MNRFRLTKYLACLVFLALALLATGCSAGASGVSAFLAPNNPQIGDSLDASFRMERFALKEELAIRQVKTDVYIITHAFPWPANSMVVEMADRTLVLVDTPYTPEATAEALRWFENRLGERRVVAINTGHHPDNLGGNPFLIERGLAVYGSAQTAELLAQQGEALRATLLGRLQDPQLGRYRQVHAQLQYLPPTRLFTARLGLELEFNGQIVQAFFPGPTHAPDNLVVYFPAQRVLFGGSMIEGGERLNSTAEADLDTWVESLENLDRFKYEILVPGHGERFDPGLLEHTLELLALTP